jgi:7,8-dihydroneopterin aldolase/epimerase/oxygenase
MSHSVVPLKIASAEDKVRHVFVRDLVVEANIGIHAHEKKKSQRIRINLDLSVVDDYLLDADNIDQVVCYEQVVIETKAIIATGHINLVEALAEQIAERILIMPKTLSVRVRVEKLDVLPDVGSVGIEIERTAR